MDDVQTISKMSNSPLRCVQSTAETSNHTEKAEIEYLWGVQMTVATSWTKGCENQSLHLPFAMYQKITTKL